MVAVIPQYEDVLGTKRLDLVDTLAEGKSDGG
jgi:hypothetical protein